MLDALGFGGGAFGMGLRSAVQRVRGEGEAERPQRTADRERARASSAPGPSTTRTVEVEVPEKGAPFHAGDGARAWRTWPRGSRT